MSYDHFRSDIAGSFPGYNNSTGPVGFKILKTSTLTNGLHTISWVVTDSLGLREGVGSRFFNVSILALHSQRPMRRLDATSLLRPHRWTAVLPELRTRLTRSP